MAATPGHVEQLVDTTYNNDSVVRVTSRVMSDSELAVKCLGTIADHIYKCNKVVQYGILAWYCVVTSELVAAILWIFIYALDVLGPVLGGVMPWFVLVCMLFGLVTVPMIAEMWLDYKAMKIVEDKLAPIIKQLKTSIMELKTASSAIAATWHMERVEVLTWENYQCIKSQKATVAAIDSVATEICLLCTLLREKRCLIAEQVVIEALPLFKQKLQSVHDITSELVQRTESTTRLL